jgi:hypothetical protein
LPMVTEKAVRRVQFLPKTIGILQHSSHLE